MQHSFTAAAERALACASGWRNCAGGDELGVPELLVGLLSEPECRAAVMLSRQTVDLPAVRYQWPTLEKELPPRGGVLCRKPLSIEVENLIQLAYERLACLPQPLELATEHLLLGLVSAEHEVAAWLRQRGLDPDMIEAEIRKLYGCEPTESAVNTREPITFEETPVGGVARPVRELLAPGYSNDVFTLRAIDAAANRAREGLRVVEDYVRFVLDDRHLTSLCKQLRHDLTAALSGIPPDTLVATRETQADVGTALTAPSEQMREDAAQVLRANFARVQEALRSLEEFSKLESSRHTPCVEADGTRRVPATLKQLRYRAYTLERAVGITRHSVERLAAARLYVLLDAGPSPEEFERLARALIDAGADVLQLRDKRPGDRELLARASLLRTLTRGTETLMVINDRPDLAALAQADGVHLGQEDVSVKDACWIVGPEVLVGVSAHSIEQARQAVLDGANYIGVGPVFPSATKQFEHFPGVELLRQVASEIRLPAFAIGGICRKNVAEVLAVGFTRIAVGAAVTGADDPAGVATKLKEMMNDE